MDDNVSIIDQDLLDDNNRSLNLNNEFDMNEKKSAAYHENIPVKGR